MGERTYTQQELDALLVGGYRAAHDDAQVSAVLGMVVSFVCGGLVVACIAWGF